jgi:hypothetical protein
MIRLITEPPPPPIELQPPLLRLLLPPQRLSACNAGLSAGGDGAVDVQMCKSLVGSLVVGKNERRMAA